MSHISLTIPSDDEKALVAGATMLLTLAGKIPNMELPAASDDGPGAEDGPRAPGWPVRCGDTGQMAPPHITTEQSISEIEDDGSCPACTPDGKCATGEGCVTTSNPPPPPPAATGDAPTTEEEGTTTTIGPELDANGLPWDARIHAGSKAKLQDGTWRKKRGVDDEDYNRVVEELKQLMAAPVRTPEPAGDGVSDDTAPVLTPEPDAATAPPPPPPPPVTTEPEPTPDTFPAFLKAVTMKVQAKELTIEQVNNALQPHGVANLQLLGGRPDLIPQVWADLVAPK